jgi:hypothetical protein
MKLRARDAEDLQVIAAVLQDAILPVKEMAYLPEQKRFVLLFNRFKWEGLPRELAEEAMTSAPDQTQVEEEGDAAFEEVDETTVFERVHAALTFDGVRNVQLRGIDRKDSSRLLELLTIEPRDGEIALVFAGDAAIRLQTRKLRVHLEDMGEPWPTGNLPRHGAPEDDAGAEPES